LPKKTSPHFRSPLPGATLKGEAKTLPIKSVSRRSSNDRKNPGKQKERLQKMELLKARKSLTIWLKPSSAVN
jgi:hypothetical protein